MSGIDYINNFVNTNLVHLDTYFKQNDASYYISQWLGCIEN